MVQRSRFSIGYYLTIFLLILLIENLFFSGSAGKELPYSKFRDLIEKNKIQSVIIESDKIYGMMKSEQTSQKEAEQTHTQTKNGIGEKSTSPPKPAFKPHQKQTPWYLNFEKKLSQTKQARYEEIQRQFTVVPLTDPTLLKDLQQHGVPFFNLSGSDFVEMFVGVGAARVRDLFKEAKAKAPCIIFIDELDAVGKSRAQGPYMGGNDERENTLNQLLSEMDGFDPQIGIIIMGATNRPDVLDPALLRPGRFDRQVLVDRPDLMGRVGIFEVHTRDLSLKSDVHLHKLAAETPGFGGAEIANVCNEAALLASRKNQDEISQNHFQDAIERVIAGLEKKNKLINPHERKVVAYHESGHAIIGHFTPGADPVQKVSIIPRGIGALGYTLQTPLEDRFLMSRSELLGKIKGLLGGRAAEEIVFGEVSTGASNDLEKMAHVLLENEKMDEGDILTILGPRNSKKENESKT